MLRVLFTFAVWGCLSATATASNWPLFGYDANRSGNAGDQGLSASNVRQLRVRWQITLPSTADSAPIVVANHLFLTSKDGTTYAIDANDGHISWRFPTHGPNITTSVPAFDLAAHVVYAPGVDGFIHKLDPQSGRELFDHGFPARITRTPQTEKNASSLNVANGFLYAQTSGYYGDATPYVGHVVAIRLSDGSRHVFNTLCSNEHTLIDPASCSGQRSGMWSRAGVVVDPDPSMGGRIYVATGNGPFDPSRGDYGDSVLALSSDATHLLSSYTPSNYSQLETGDLDVGSSSPALLPRQAGSTTPLMAVQVGKDSTLRLLDRTKLGGVGNALQTIPLGGRLFGAPAIWTDRKNRVRVFIDLLDGVHAYELVTSGGKSRLVSGWHADVASNYEGSSPVLSGGVLFVAASGALVGLDAQNGRPLWHHTIGAIHWESPVVVNGFLYCADDSGNLTAFGLGQGRP